MKTNGNFTNEFKKMPDHGSWRAMWERCTNTKYRKYNLYGGRGITVCDRWKSFQNFIDDMGYKPDKKYSIERKDSNANYCPENCLWATQKEQMRNTSKNKFLTFNGITKCVSEWCEELGITISAVVNRLEHGWIIERTLSTPVRKIINRKMEINGEIINIKELSRQTGIKYSTILQRLSKNWPIEKILSNKNFCCSQS